MGILVSLIAIVVAFAVFYFIAREFYEIAEMKGFTESKYLWIPFLFPIGGYLLVIALPDRNQKEVKVTMTTTDVSVKQTTRFESDELPNL